MKEAVSIKHPQNKSQNDDRIQQTVTREQKRLLSFIRQRVPQEADAEDILQDVFYQFISSSMLAPIEQTASWLFKVATNKITDWYRKRKPLLFSEQAQSDNDGNEEEDAESFFLPQHFNLFDSDNNPDLMYLRALVWEELEAALAELPPEQQEVFILHELEARSFKEISELTSVAVNTLLARKRYAVLYLRKRLQALYEDLINY